MTRFSGLSLSLALVTTAALTSCKKEPPPPDTRLRPVKYAVVGAGNGDKHDRSFSASIIARDATQLSFRVGGNLATLRVKMGDTVKKKQLIGKLDDSDYKVTLSQAQANYQSAKTQRDTARSAFQRAERLFEAGSSSQADYETAKGAVRSADAQLSAAGQQVKQARNQLGYTTLEAPFAGVVNSVPVKPGELVAAGQPIAVVSRGGELEVSLGVPENMIASVKVGTPASIEVSALDKTLEGTVREVGFTAEGSTYPVRVALAEPPAELRPGMAANASFKVGKATTALSVPAAAVGNSEKSSFVFRLEGDGKSLVARKTSVVLGRLLGDSFEIKEGLASGDRVATAGLSTLVDGMNVRLLEESDRP